MIDWSALPQPLPPAGVDIDVRATFSGLRFLPSLLASGKNNRSPALRLHDDRVVIKVMKSVEIPYASLKLVDAQVIRKTNNVTFTSGSLSKPTANLRERDDLVGLLRFLQGKGVALSKRAAKLTEG